MYKQSPFRRIENILGIRNVPDSEDLEKSLNRAIPSLLEENSEIRPLGSDEKPGGLIVLKHIPTIIVPDLHGRIDYLRALLLWRPPGSGYNVYQELSMGKLQVICVGDGFHSEARGLLRWKDALKEFTGEFKKHRAMDEEMKESLGVMMVVMELKSAFPDFFHFLKGNHENVLNEDSLENRPFRKFVFEGAMVKLWFEKFINNKTFKKYYQFEKLLPVFAIGNRFCVSHAEPRKYYSREKLIEAEIDREIIFDFTWTANDEAEKSSVLKYLDEYFPGDSMSLMFGGHRPVKDKYLTRADGRYLQIHNPDEFIAVYIQNMSEFSKERNILILPNREVR
jgi:Calcineurin-like phosphoesterase